MLEPNLGNAYYGRGQAHMSSEHYRNAITDFSQAIRINPQNVNYYNVRGFSYTNIQKYREALTDLFKAKQLDQNNGETYFNLGFCYFKQKKLQEALPYYERASQLGFAQEIDWVSQLKRLMNNSEKKQQNVKSGKVGRNDPCPCGSGKKYKKCCLNNQG